MLRPSDDGEETELPATRAMCAVSDATAPSHVHAVCAVTFAANSLESVGSEAVLLVPASQVPHRRKW